MSKPIPRPGILSIAPYQAGKSAIAGKLADNLDILKLSSNESALGASPKAVAAYQAASDTLHRYPDSAHIAFRAALSEKFNIPLPRIICGAGSDELIGLLTHAFCTQGDEVIHSQYGFLMYPIYARAAGATPISVPEKNYKSDVDALLAAITPRTKIMFLAQPNNPTGSYLTQHEMARLIEGIPPHVILAIDGAYVEYVTAADYPDPLKLALTHDNIVMLRTFSKIYGIPALRLGWGVFPDEIADAVNRIRGPFNVSSPALAAGIAALQDDAHTQVCIAENNRALEFYQQNLSKLGLKPLPSVGNFVLVEFAATGSHTASAANQFLLSQGIIVREVANYGLPNCLRITTGTHTQNQRVVEALSRFMSGL